MANPNHEMALRDAVAGGISSPDLCGSDLSAVRMSSVRLEGANLRDTDLRGADFSGGYFRGCDLHDARLNKARIPSGDFRDADLSGADLTAANLTGAVLSGARLCYANLSRASLVKCYLKNADLTGANLERTDLRGALGLTAEQLSAAINSNKAILDERMLSRLGWAADTSMARHGRRTPQHSQKDQVDLAFGSAKPSFGDLFLLCGSEHPEFPPTGSFGFEKLADLGFEQADDYFAICDDGDPVIWLFPLVNGRAVVHHPGPYDGVRLVLDARSARDLWSSCVTRVREALRIANAGGT